MLAPRRVRRADAERFGGSEPEAGVVLDVAEQHDDGMVEGVGSPEHGVHQRAADAAALVLGEDAERAEPERPVSADRADRAHDMADDGTACILRDQGERRDPPGVGAEVAHEGDLGRRAGEPGPGERRGAAPRRWPRRRRRSRGG